MPQEKRFMMTERAPFVGPHENKSRPPCGHVFCFQCLAEWCRIRQQCPMCNRRITSFKHSIDSENNFQVHQPQRHRRQRINERRQRRPLIRLVERRRRILDFFLFFSPTWVLSFAALLWRLDPQLSFYHVIISCCVADFYDLLSYAVDDDRCVKRY